MLRTEPVTGVGPGRFKELSPTARRDQDRQWAHHGFLQQGAETGAIGLALLAGLFLWGFARLALSDGPARAVALVSVAVLGLAAHACIDYVLHFPAVPLSACALVAVPSSPRGSR
jgi:O-antigen ligase